MNDKGDDLLPTIRMMRDFQTFELLEDELEKTINIKNDLMRWTDREKIKR